MKEKPLFKDLNILIVFCITIFAVMGVASITPAFPKIIRHYGLTAGQIGYLITVFTFPGIFLLPFIGILADRFGRKTILIPSMLLFGVAGFLCAFQTDFRGLLILRFFQGIGASALGSLNITLIGDLFSGEKRVKAMGYNSSILSIGTASFPAIGGLLAASDWRYPFFLPGLIIPFILVVIFKLKTPKTRESISFGNYLGKVWKTINRKEAWGLFLSNILLFIILYGSLLTFFPILMAERFQSGPFTIGITMSVMSLTAALASSQFGFIRKRFNPPVLFIFSSCIYAVAMVMLAFAANWALLVGAVVLFGLGHGLFLPNIQSMLVGMAPLSERAAFMSINGTVLRTGQTLGPVVAGLFYINQNLTPVFLSGAGIALLIAVIIKIMVGKVE